MKGSIILVPFPFTDLTTSKRRPALVLHERQNDLVVLFISSIIPSVIEENHVVISSSHPEYKNTGLKIDSVIFLDKIATLSKRLIAGQIGVVGKRVKREINKKFPRLYKL